MNHRSQIFTLIFKIVLVSFILSLARPSVNAQTVLYEEDFNDLCFCYNFPGDRSTLPDRWSIDDGSVVDYYDGSGHGTDAPPSYGYTNGFNGVYTCESASGSYQPGGTNYSGFSGNWLNITSHPSGNFINRFSDATYIVTEPFHVDPCRYNDIKLEFEWQLVSGASNTGQLEVSIWFGGVGGEWVPFFFANGNSDSSMSDASPFIVNGECGGTGNGSLSNPDQLNINCFVANNEGPFRIRFAYIDSNPTSGGGVGIDDFKITGTNISNECHPDYDELMALFNATEGENWNINTGWIDGYNCTNCDVCAWEGITCNGANRVTRIELPMNNLEGYLPQQLIDLPYLEALSLFENQIYQNIPGEIFNILPLLELNLNTNDISGSLPAELTNAANLEALLISDNNLTGSIPDNIYELTNLVTLDLSYNNLINSSGFLPSGIGLLPNVSSINLSNNDFYGCWPASYSNLCNNISVNFSGNNLVNNNFIEFCNDQKGACVSCSENMALSSVYVQSITFEVEDKISSTGGALPGSDLHYYAGDEICLDPGFFVAEEAVFQAEIRDCLLAQPNYTCQDALDITLDASRTYESTAPDQGNGCNECSGSAAHAVWFKYTAQSNTSIDIYSCNNGVNTRLWIYTGACNNLIPYANSDDDCTISGAGSATFASEIINLPVTSGTSYYIEWDNAWSNDRVRFKIHN